MKLHKKSYLKDGYPHVQINMHVCAIGDLHYSDVVSHMFWIVSGPILAGIFGDTIFNVTMFALECHFRYSNWTTHAI
jgi:hypothetical protein